MPLTDTQRAYRFCLDRLHAMDLALDSLERLLLAVHERDHAAASAAMLRHIRSFGATRKDVV